ncbi:GNAT family N-acetyltransferase [Streptomyces sp. SID3343]|uniref:GNAT family N-acetyltransferase n=1 Tax=Streptomyces sp. SID3343 TaxID=2690260 RepID=UPI00136F06C1|nr:GNAT family N-acetyltransferase [Streptomyces sp. SID3343]MYW01347.1 GNAT family N-acetyltransferase [Streptomyces sp. SID3343]
MVPQDASSRAQQSPEELIPVSFRIAETTDIPALVTLIESAYRGEGSRQGWTTEADLLGGGRTDADAVGAVIDAADSVMCVAERDGLLVGCCQLERRADSVVYFGMFAIRPGRQGGGLGRVLLAEAERVAAESWGGKTMHMTVIRQREELIAWYERRGYLRTGILSPFPYGDERFGIPLRDDLEFELLTKDI